MSFLIHYIYRLTTFCFFCVLVLIDVTRASLRVAMDVITPNLRAKPAIVPLPLDCISNIQITWLSNVISLTPGTLVIDISPQKDFLYIHVMYLDDEEKLIRNIKHRYEHRIKEILS